MSGWRMDTLGIKSEDFTNNGGSDAKQSMGYSWKFADSSHSERPKPPVEATVDAKHLEENPYAPEDASQNAMMEIWEKAQRGEKVLYQEIIKLGNSALSDLAAALGVVNLQQARPKLVAAIQEKLP